MQHTPPGQVVLFTEKSGFFTSGAGHTRAVLLSGATVESVVQFVVAVIVEQLGNREKSDGLKIGEHAPMKSVHTELQRETASPTS